MLELNIIRLTHNRFSSPIIGENIGRNAKDCIFHFQSRGFIPQNIVSYKKYKRGDSLISVMYGFSLVVPLLILNLPSVPLLM